MEIIELSLNSSNLFLTDLYKNTLHNELFFDYNIHSTDVFKQRAIDLQSRSFQREKLANYLLQYNKRFSETHPETIKSIEKLRNSNSTVVIGGQQAGVLTGPLYTIHKIISIITLAKEQEEKLNIPVIPVFWIAGEDHDFLEINHVFVEKNNLVKKSTIKQAVEPKIPVSEIALDRKVCLEWVKQVIETYGESDYTNELLQQLECCIERSTTYVQFFEELIMNLFKDQGLVLINSGDHQLRQLEKDFFTELIEKNHHISNDVLTQQKLMQTYHYNPIVDMHNTSANLFFHDSKKRFLMERVDEEVFFVPDLNVSFKKHELHQIAAETPEKLSNNVVTRPLMQEYLFPTLAFIAGPGEINYWAEFKNTFSLFGFKMPPVLPRLNLTILERSIEREMTDISLSLELVLENKLEIIREEYLKNVAPVEMEPLVKEAKSEVAAIHQKLVDAALTVDSNLEPLLEKNAAFIQHQLDFLHKAVEKRLREKHEGELSTYRRIEMSLNPNAQPQERIWNIYYYLNKFGPEFVGELTNLSYSFNGKHKLVKI
ncbi:bacillithiol biosynthesis cysteine-adding enzyme BshC [Metabacillus herbersteinensis]|uniref:Putative cysteine ligase BshC n=1 Tax=Metabacillus herbersteinensis TaxID=283816 RepID=A0ABV6GBY5_9BACI